MYKTETISAKLLLTEIVTNKRGKYIGGGDEFPGKPNAEELSKDIETMCNRYESDGYHVVSITPIIRGNYAQNCGYGYGFGYGYTEGVIILFKK